MPKPDNRVAPLWHCPDLACPRTRLPHTRPGKCSCGKMLIRRSCDNPQCRLCKKAEEPDKVLIGMGHIPA